MNLSGGNVQKCVVAREFTLARDLIIAEEPTRGVDVGARQELYQIIKDLAADGIAIVIVSSDLPEIMSICERVIVMHEGRITGELQCSEMTEEKIMYYAANV